MRILYDYQAFEMQDFGGVSKCFCELISNLPKDIQATIAIKQSNNVHLRGSGLVSDLEPYTINEKIFRKKLLPFKRTKKLYQLMTALGVVKGAEYYNHRLSIDELKEQDFDVFHPTFFDPYFLKYIGDKPWVCTIHDMMPEIYPQYYGAQNSQTTFKQKYLKYASAIVAVSQTTKDDLVRMMNVPEDKVTVIYHGGPQIEKITDRPLVDFPYFLYVGTRAVYKNFKQTVIDFGEFYKNHHQVRMVCTGSPFTEEEKELFSSLNLQDAILYFRPNDQQLKNMYTNAIAFIYPSLYEGFGMPILEAYAYGCPVLLNDINIFHEVAGDAAMFFKSDGTISDLPNHLEEMFEASKDQKQEMAEKGYEQLSKFSWKKSAEKLGNLYKGLI